MIRIVVDEKTTEALRRSGEVVLVCDSSGQILGKVIRDDSIPVDLDPHITEEELDRREKAGGGRPLRDILRDLESRQ